MIISDQHEHPKNFLGWSQRSSSLSLKISVCSGSSSSLTIKLKTDHPTNRYKRFGRSRYVLFSKVGMFCSVRLIFVNNDHK